MKLIRKSDNKIIKGEIKYVEFDEFGYGKKLHKKPKVGYSCIVDAKKGKFYTWMTSSITEVISNNEFKTNNSHYTIEI